MTLTQFGRLCILERMQGRRGLSFVGPSETEPAQRKKCMDGGRAEPGNDCAFSELTELYPDVSG